MAIYLREMIVLHSESVQQLSLGGERRWIRLMILTPVGESSTDTMTEEIRRTYKEWRQRAGQGILELVATWSGILKPGSDVDVWKSEGSGA